jgi:cell fate regulator YaaT (PSP1 superfamily)
MIAPAQAAAPALPAVLTDQFIASYGKSGGLGCFTARTDAAYQRGDRVLLQTPRGLEAGVVLGGATLRQARLLGSQSSGAIVRPLDGDDEAELRQLRQRSDDVFALGRQIAAERRLAVEILDAELLADGKQAILHIAARAEDALGDFAADLARRVGVNVVFENLSASVAADEEPAHGGCGKPDCGKAEGGGCSSCGAGGCSSCGKDPVDLRPYFEHLRAKMEEHHRTPLL